MPRTSGEFSRDIISRSRSPRWVDNSDSDDDDDDDDGGDGVQQRHHQQEPQPKVG